MKKLGLLFFLFVSNTLVSGQIPLDSIQAIIKREVAAKRGKSIIVGIVDSTGKRQIFAEGFINEQGRRPDGNTLYEIGSITKIFTSLLLADLSLKNQLSLNDPISKYLPSEVKSPTWNGKEISLLSLATHRSGMPRFPYNVDTKFIDMPYKDYSAEDLYNYISSFDPPDIDTRWRYSNVAYGLLGLLLERVAKQEYEAMLIERICRPLNMKNTFISLKGRDSSNIAIGHMQTGTPVDFEDLGAISAGGAIRSSVNDLLTFAEANLGLLPTNLYPAMKLTHVLQAKKDGNDTYTTMGWTLANDKGYELLFKDGGMPGYRSFFGIDPTNKIGVVVFSNSCNSVTDIGWHLLDSNHKIEPYSYPWSLLDSLRTTVQTKGVTAAIALYAKLKDSKNPDFHFNEAQLYYLGNELRTEKKIHEAIKIYELNASEYPNSTWVYESLAETYKLLGNKEEAIKYFEMARNLDDQNQHWEFMIGRLKQ